MKRYLLIAGVALLVVLLLFDVDVNPRFALPAETEQVDAEQEARFAACLAEQDRIVHAETFAAIDNPDVQREVLSVRMEQAARECREAYPERRVTIETPFQFNLIDLEFRF